MNMTFKFKFIIFHFLFMLMTHGVRSHPCEYGTVKRVFFANCSRMHLDTFPANLKENIEGLYLSYNYLEWLPNNTFEHYPSIRFLYLEENKLDPDSHVFAPLTKLEHLDLSKNPHLDVSNLYLPKSLKALHLNGLKTIKTDLPISSLDKLTFLSLIRCKLDKVPSFGGSLPSLDTLWLTENRLQDFKIDNFAYLCRLKRLHINSTSIQNNCECLRLKSWMDTQKITGSVITCKDSKNKEDCNLTLPDSFLQNQASCERLATINDFLSWFLIGCIAFVVCFFLIMLYVCCNKKGFFCYVMRCKCFC